MARRASVFARETIPSLVDRYPGTGVSVPAEPIPGLPGVALSRHDSTLGVNSFADRFGSFPRGKVTFFYLGIALSVKSRHLVSVG